MHLVDNYIIIWHDNKIEMEKLPKATLNFGRILNPKVFYNYLENIIKKFKLNNGLINGRVTVVTSPINSMTELEIIKNCLEKLSFTKIKFINLVKLFNIKRNYLFIVFNKSYLYLLNTNYKQKLDTIFIDYKLFKNNINILTKYLSTIIKKKNVIILGYNPSIDLFAIKLEKISNSKVYYVEDLTEYIFNKIKNTL